MLKRSLAGIIPGPPDESNSSVVRGNEGIEVPNAERHTSSTNGTTADDSSSGTTTIVTDGRSSGGGGGGSVRLMLHCADGAIPFLTPYLLQRCFPAHQVDDVLSIGLAVRDTCLVPFFQQKNVKNPGSKKKKKKENAKNTAAATPREGDDDDDDGAPTADAAAVAAQEAAPLKLRGYTFSAGSGSAVVVRPDPWLLPYQRITVPTFDPTDDVFKFGNNGTTDNIDTPVSAAANSASANRNGVSLWTCNGRHPITSQQYHGEAVLGLASGTLVPLFERIVPCQKNLPPSAAADGVIAADDDNDVNDAKKIKNKNASVEMALQRANYAKRRSKHKQAVALRNRAWTADALVGTALQNRSTNSRSSNFTGTTTAAAAAPSQQQLQQPPLIVWAPFAVAADTDVDRDATDTEQMAWIADTVLGGGGGDNNSKNNAASDAACCQGVALIGWHRIPDADRRWTILQSIGAHLTKIAAAAVEHAPVSSLSTTTTTTIASLSTNSTVQILQLLAYSCSNSTAVAKVVIGTDLPAVWARSKRAFVVDVAAWKKKKNRTDAQYGHGNKSNNDSNSNKRACLAQSRDTLEPTTPPPPTTLQQLTLDEDGCVDLNPVMNDRGSTRVDQQQHQQHPWFRDPGPLVPGCSCLTCRSHSRAYLHHLVCSKELLVEMLLFIHNLHHMLMLLRSINECHSIGLGTTDVAAAVTDLCDHVKSQLLTAESKSAT